MIDNFSGEHRFLSNFHPSPVRFEGKRYPTVEHAFQAAKTDDEEDREKIRTCGGAGKAKSLGRRVSLRKDWESVKVSIMEGLVRAKFEDEALRALLLATGDEELVEGNTWGDRFWGVCGGSGKNHLGKILMRVRGELRDAATATGP